MKHLPKSAKGAAAQRRVGFAFGSGEEPTYLQEEEELAELELERELDLWDSDFLDDEEDIVGD